MVTAEVLKIVNEAKKKGMWIYSPSYRRWYSPEDFQHIFNYAEAREDFLKQLQIKHPREGIEAGFKRLTEIQIKLEAFVKTVVEYYNR